MKIIALALTLLLPVFASAAEDCAKSSDACSAGKKAFSPFLAASAAEPEAPRPPAPAKKAAPPKAAVSTAPAAAEIPAPAPAAPDGARASSPAWALLVIAGLAGLYYYLSGGRRGRRK